jgi:cyclophilin family peptidyl-prolyl cis-trans isomerase
MANPKVEVQTNHGRFVIELFGDKAPKSVENFLSYVGAGHYDGTIFHRVIPNFMAQGGGFDVSYTKKAVRGPVQNEADNGLKNTRGTVAMARTSDPHSATCQFFVNLVDNGFLDHTKKEGAGWGYTVFGQVTEGMDVVDKIAKVKTGAKGSFDKDAPQDDVVITTAKRL